MPGKLTKTQLAEYILKEDFSSIEDEEEIIHLLKSNTVAKNIYHTHRDTLTTGQRMADRLAAFAGSWTFIIGFILVLLGWIVLNVAFLLRPFDPYPFILLNLVLSCVAAIQAPVIMMSQNRQEAKDRLRAENDYKVNLKAEILIEDMHDKLDKVLARQEILLKRLSEKEDSPTDQDDRFGS
jgi:uncharacterized membrane protein